MTSIADRLDKAADEYEAIAAAATQLTLRLARVKARLHTFTPAANDGA